MTDYYNVDCTQGSYSSCTGNNILWNNICVTPNIIQNNLSAYVTGPAKRDQVGTKYTISQNGTYLEFCVQYLFSFSCRILPMQLLIDSKNFTYIALADH